MTGSTAPVGDKPRDQPIILSEAERRQRRSRSVAIALVLGGLAALFYLITIAKIGVNILNRPL